MLVREMNLQKKPYLDQILVYIRGRSDNYLANKKQIQNCLTYRCSNLCNSSEKYGACKIGHCGGDDLFIRLNFFPGE